MTTRDGRDARQPYRVRVSKVWYWVDPTVPMDAIESGDRVVIYPVSGDAALAILQTPFRSPTPRIGPSIFPRSKENALRRSEERRVGKECKCRGMGTYLKK